MDKNQIKLKERVRVMTKSKTIVVLAVISSLLLVACGGGKKKKLVISEKTKSLFGAKWTYDQEATRTAVLTKTGKATGIKNLKDIKLKGDVKKMADAFTHRTLYFAKDKKDRGIGYFTTTGKGILQSKSSGWLNWNADESEFTLAPTDKKRKSVTYKLVSVDAKKLVILNKASKTNTPEVWVR